MTKRGVALGMMALLALGCAPGGGGGGGGEGAGGAGGGATGEMGPSPEAIAAAEGLLSITLHRMGNSRVYLRTIASAGLPLLISIKTSLSRDSRCSLVSSSLI